MTSDARELLFGITVYGCQQIVDLTVINAHILGPTFIGNVRRADKAEIVLIGVDEDDALVVVLQEIGMGAIPEFAAR